MQLTKSSDCRHMLNSCSIVLGRACSLHTDLKVPSSNLVWISKRSMVNFQALYLPASKLSQESTYKACWEICLLYFCWVLHVVGGGSTCSQDWGTNMGHLWFVKYGQSGATRRSSQCKYIIYNQQYNILELREKGSTSTGNLKHTI